MESLSRTDKKLLASLQDNGRARLADLAELAHLSISQTQRRVRQLEDSGIIEAYSARINSTALGYESIVLVEVRLKYQGSEATNEFHAAVEDTPEILECYRISGDADYMLKVIARDLKDYSRFAQDVLMNIPQIERLQSHIILEPIKETTTVPCR